MTNVKINYESDPNTICYTTAKTQTGIRYPTMLSLKPK